ncbi:MAG: hypothetical protein R3C04_10690 [Hyphomonas sp.]
MAGHFARDQVVTIRLRAIRSDIRRYWVTTTLTFDDTYVIQRKMSRDVLVSTGNVTYKTKA